MKDRRLLVLAIWAINVVLLLCMATVVVASLTGSPEAAGPMVELHSPHPGDRVQVGDIVAVHSTSSDEAHGVARVELWVDGELIEVDTSFQGAAVLSLAQGWQPLSPGRHTLTVRAFNEADDHGQATISLEVEESPEEAAVMGEPPGEESPPPETPPEGEVVEGPPQELAPPAPGGFPPDEEGAPDGESPSDSGVAPNPDAELALERDVRDRLAEAVLPDEMGDPSAMIEFRVLSLYVAGDYEKVYCYASLAGEPVERVPGDEDQFFEPISEGYWDVASHLGEEGRVLIPVPADESLEVFVEGFGWSGGEIHYLGRIDVAHPPEHWDGEFLSVDATGGEGFSLGYAILDAPDAPQSPRTSAPDAPFRLQVVNVNDREYLHWGWMGDAEEIDGFKLYRNEALIGTLSADEMLHPLRTVAPCNEVHEYYVTAYRGAFGSEQEESWPSNTASYQGPPCDGLDDVGEPAMVENFCTGSGIALEVPYTYQSEHGDEVYLGVWAETGGTPIAQHVRVRHGEGTARIELLNELETPVDSHRFRVYLMDEDGWYFYSETFDHSLSWSAPRPDLTVAHDVMSCNYRYAVDVRNVGCAPVDRFVLQIQTPQVERWGSIDRTLRPGETFHWVLSASELFYEGTEEERRQAFDDLFLEDWVQVTVDPLDAIPEDDEENNQYWSNLHPLCGTDPFSGSD